MPDTQPSASALIQDLKDEQTFLASCREMCDEDDEGPRWDRLQRVIDFLALPAPVSEEIPPQLSDMQTSHAIGLYLSSPHNMESADFVVKSVATDAYVNGFQAGKICSAPAPVSEPIYQIFAHKHSMSACWEDVPKDMFDRTHDTQRRIVHKAVPSEDENFWDAQKWRAHIATPPQAVVAQPDNAMQVHMIELISAIRHSKPDAKQIAEKALAYLNETEVIKTYTASKS